MTHVAAWVGAGVFTAGVSAAVLAGAGTANADDHGPSKHDKPSTSAHRDSGHRNAHPAKRHARPKVSDSGSGDAKPAATTDATTDAPSRNVRTVADTARSKVRNVIRESAKDRAESRQRAVEVRARPPIRIRAARAELRERLQRPLRNPQSESLTAATEEQKVEPRQAATRPDPIEAIHDVIRTLGALTLNPEAQNYPKPLTVVTDAVFNTLATLERVVGGDPVVPPALKDSVQVSTSTLVVSPGHEVEANWYFPTTGSGDAPTRMIYLQHGFLANGPLYSYTASYLAEQTNSIVVTTTYSSNPFAEDGMWLGGDNLHEAVAQLFLDPERTALNASMDTAELKAGREENVDVPTEFVLVGHSLGGGFAPGVAGYYAEGLATRREAGEDAPNDLAGVVTYDAVPMGSIIPDAMNGLADLEASDHNNPDDYIPIYEIGAPLNYLNVFSDVNDQLTTARPGQFTGVVLRGGVHMDSMQGANPLIQAAAFLIAGFPEPQNPLAVRELSAGWINDMFDDKIDPATGACATDCAGQYGTDPFAVHTDKGDAVAVPIGTQEASDLSSLRNISLTDFISAIPAGVFNGVVTTCDLFTGGKCSA